MKAIFVKQLAILFCFLPLFAGEEPKSPNRGQTLVETTEIVERGPHWQTVQKLLPVQDEQGVWSYQTNSYVHLEPGLNYEARQGEWVEAKEIFELLPEGAVARQGQHQVTLPANLNGEQPVVLVQPDGQRLTSRPRSLAYYDTSTGESVLLAELKDCQGFQVTPNQILYPNAFDAVRADLRYTYTKAGFEQDIVLREAPPAPEKYGLNSKTSRLEVWTEFTEAPEPAKISNVLNGGAVAEGRAQVFADEELDFGTMKIGAGRAFRLGADGGRSVPVGKSWIQVKQRTFLLEAVELSDVEAYLNELPAAPDGASVRRKPGQREVVLRQLPRKVSEIKHEQASIRPATKELLVALAQPALVLDYLTLNAGTLAANYVFKGDTTYLLNGAVTASTGTTTFEGGAVLKYAPSAVLTVNTALDWRGSLYRPVVLTAKDDHSVGEKIGVAVLTGTYATTALNLTATTPAHTLKHLRIAFAQTGIALAGGNGHIVGHAQMLNCGVGISAAAGTQYGLQNALFDHVTTCFSGGASVLVEHLTADTGTTLNQGVAALTLKNSLLVNLTSAIGYSGINNVQFTGSGVFQTVQAGAHYLANGSPYRNLGTTLITPVLLAELSKLTTYPPALLPTTISVATTLGPLVQRDTDVPDLGYHYPPLDYVGSNITVNNATLSLVNGVAVAAYGAKLMNLTGTGQLKSSGLPQKLNRLTTLQTVQEQSEALVTVTTSFVLINGSGVDFNFTDVSFMGGPARYLLPNGNTYPSGAFVNSSFRGWSWADYATSSPYPNITFKNNVFERCNFQFGGMATPYYEVNLNWRNNLFRNSTVQLNFDLFAGSFTWTLYDNVFDTVSLTLNRANSSITASHNAYYNTTKLFYVTGTEITLTGPLNWQKGPLGDYYYPTPDGGTSLPSLIDADATVTRTPALLGLYHFTTRIDLQKDSATSTTSDIGFHYVATDTSGNPLDYDGDSLADYLEDTDGSGTHNGGDMSSWSNADSDLDGVGDFQEISSGTDPNTANATLMLLTPQVRLP